MKIKEAIKKQDIWQKRAKQKKNVCCICGREFRGYGNNPYPIREEGNCCDECNRLVVIERIKLLK